MATSITESCEVCGRRIEIDRSLLGQSVSCPHCQASFLAPTQVNQSGVTPGELELVAHLSGDESDLMKRVHSALERSGSHRGNCR